MVFIHHEIKCRMKFETSQRACLVPFKGFKDEASSKAVLKLRGNVSQLLIGIVAYSEENWRTLDIFPFGVAGKRRNLSCPDIDAGVHRSVGTWHANTLQSK